MSAPSSLALAVKTKRLTKSISCSALLIRSSSSNEEGTWQKHFVLSVSECSQMADEAGRQLRTALHCINLANVNKRSEARHTHTHSKNILVCGLLPAATAAASLANEYIYTFYMPHATCHTRTYLSTTRRVSITSRL